MIFRRIFILITILINFLNQVSSLENLNDIYLSSIKSWLNGRIDDAIGGFEYIVHNSTDTTLTIQAGKDLITLLNDKGENSVALAYADKLLTLKNDDDFLLFEKSYSQILLNDMIKAKKTLDDILSITSDDDRIYTSRFIKSIIESKITGYEKATKEIEVVYKNYKPLLASSSYLMSEYIKPFKKMASINFLKDSLTYDSKNIQALIDLAQIYEETKYYTQSWQAYFTLREFEGKNSYADEKTKKLIKKINKSPDELFFWSRIAWPLHDKPLPITNQNQIRIALYCDKSYQRPPLLSFYIVSNSEFEITEFNSNRKFQGKKNMQYQIFYDISNRQIEIKDNFQNTLFVMRRGFEIKPKTPGGITLIKSPKFRDEVFGLNRGDREISGKILVEFSPEGMKLINHTYIDHIIPSIIQTIEGPKDNDTVIQTLGIIIRTMLLRKLNPNLEYDILDNEEKLEFKGLQFEKEKTAKILNQTKYILKKAKELYPADYTINTANIINGKPLSDSSFPQNLTPSTLKEWLFFDITKKISYSTPLNSSEISNISWLVILKPQWIEERINRTHKIGKIKNIFVLKRDNIGRVNSIKIEGTANNLIIEGEKEINKYLAAGTLRSNLFVIMQIKKGKFPEYFIIKGSGSGNFSGLCLYGADYLAKNMNYNYLQLIKYYFPDATVSEK